MKKSRFLSLILAVLLLVGAVPFTASAITSDGKIDTDDLAKAIGDTRLEPYLLNSQYSIESSYDAETETVTKHILWKEDGADDHGIGYRISTAAANTQLFSQPFTLSVTMYRDGLNTGDNPGPNTMANILRLESGTVKVRVMLGWSNLYFGEGASDYLYKADGTAAKFDKNVWRTLKMWVDPTKSTDNVKVYLDDEQLYFDSAKKETLSVDFSGVGSITDLTMLHHQNAGFVKGILVSDFSVVSDDLTAEGAYNASLNISAMPGAMDYMVYGKDYTLFADEGATADDTLAPYVRAAWHIERWELTNSQYGSNSYVIFDGAMPVDMTVLTMNETTDGETPVALYAINTCDPDAQDLSAAKNTEIIMELLKMGFIVVVTDFGDDPRAVSPNLDWAIKAMRIKLSGTTVVSYTHHKYDIYLVPEGYLVARNLAFFDFEDHAAKGAEEYIVSMFNGIKKGTDWSTSTSTTTGITELPEGVTAGIANGTSVMNVYTYYEDAGDGTYTKKVVTYNGFRYQKMSSIPVDTTVSGDYETYPDTGYTIYDKNGNPVAKRVTATNFETCLNKDGTPVELRLNQDVIYPATVENSPVVLISSSSEEKMGVCSTNKERPLDDAFLLNGCAVAIFEHVYSPMSRTDHYGYFSPGFSMNAHLAAHVQSAAARCVRYFADTYGYDTENYAAMGHSKGSCAAYLANPNPDKLTEISTFSGQVNGDNYGEQPYLCYADGTPIKSGVDMVYSSMGPGINNYRYNFISEGGANMMLACGLWDDVVSDSWSWWTTKGLVSDFEEYGVSYVALTELELAHDYPYLVDNYYNYDRYMAFADVMTYNIKDGIAPRILYSSIVDSRVVDRAFDADGDGVADATINLTKPQMSTEEDGLGESVLGIVTGNIDGKVVGSVTVTGRSVSGSKGKATLTRGTDLYVQFTCAVTEASVKAHMYLKDSSGNLVDGELVGTAGGTKWEFVPSAALTDGTTYTLVVEAGIVDVKNAIATTDSANYTFTWGE